MFQVWEMLLYEGVEAYKKEGPKFLQRLVAKTAVSRYESFFVGEDDKSELRFDHFVGIVLEEVDEKQSGVEAEMGFSPILQCV